MTDRHTRKDRLERAGYRHVAVWLPDLYAAQVERMADDYRAHVERIAAEPKPRGRPKKETMK